MSKHRLYKHYKHVVCEDLIVLYNYSSVMQLPTVERAICSTTSNSYLSERKLVINALSLCLLCTGQKAVQTRAHRSIAAFGLREGALIGCMSTLRKGRAYILIDRLLAFILPRYNPPTKQRSNHENHYVYPYHSRPQHSCGTAVSGENHAVVKAVVNRVQPNSSSISGWVEGRPNLTLSQMHTATPNRRQDYNLGTSNASLCPEIAELYDRFDRLNGVSYTLSFHVPKNKIGYVDPYTVTRLMHKRAILSETRQKVFVKSYLPCTPYYPISQDNRYPVAKNGTTFNRGQSELYRSIGTHTINPLFLSAFQIPPTFALASRS